MKNKEVLSMYTVIVNLELPYTVYFKWPKKIYLFVVIML